MSASSIEAYTLMTVVLVVAELNTEGPKTFVNAHRELRKLTGKLILDGEADAMNTSVLGWLPLPEEGVTFALFLS